MVHYDRKFNLNTFSINLRLGFQSKKGRDNSPFINHTMTRLTRWRGKVFS